MPLRRVLHVDDDADIRSIVKFSLESLGEFRVMSCESGVEALNAVDAFEPDLVLLDLMMPGMDGERLFARLRDRDETRSTPVIFVTAQAMDDTRVRLLDLGALDVISKPFDPLTLPVTIQEAIEAG